MRLALFDDHRLGVVVDREVVDVTGVVPGHDADLGASFWVRLCRDLEELRPELEASVEDGPRTSLDAVRLQAPVLNPSKVIAAASNYQDHVEEMRPRGVTEWMLDFDVFLKAPSSITGPDSKVRLPDLGSEIHYEGELALVIGTRGKDIDPADALSHVLGYTILLDITERGKGDRSRRKSYDGFTPVGPWVVTADEVGAWEDLQIKLWLNGELRQDVKAGEMLQTIPNIISYASSVMTLLPGDVITTGAPPGVGEVVPGDRVHAEIPQVGALDVEFV